MNLASVAYINEENCIGCKICVDVCPFDAIVGAQNYSHRVIYNECPGCKICVEKCPTDCIIIIDINQDKKDIKDKVKFNFQRKKLRVGNHNKDNARSIKEQLKKIITD